MPENTVYVGRPTRWANPYRVGETDRRTGGMLDHDTAVERYSDALVLGRLRFTLDDCAALRGKSLACWCRLDQACHATVLLEWANQPICEAA